MNSLQLKPDDASVLPRIKPPTTKSQIITPRSQVFQLNASNSLTMSPNGMGLFKYKGSLEQLTSLENHLPSKMTRNRSVQEMSQIGYSQNRASNKKVTTMQESHEEMLKRRSSNQGSLVRADSQFIGSQNSVAEIGESNSNPPSESLSLTEFLNGYKPLDPNLFEELKSLPDVVFFRVKNGLYYGETSGSSIRHGKGEFICL